MGRGGYPVGHEMGRQRERVLPQTQVGQQAGMIPFEFRSLVQRPPHPDEKDLAPGKDPGIAVGHGPHVQINRAGKGRRALFHQVPGDFRLEPQMPEIHGLQTNAPSHPAPGAVGSHNDLGLNQPPGGGQSECVPRARGDLLQPFPLPELPSGLPHPFHEKGVEPLPLHCVEQRLMPGPGEVAAQIKAQLHPANFIFQNRAQVRGQELKCLDGQAAGTDFDPRKGGLIENKGLQTPLQQLVSQGGSGGAGPDDGNLATDRRQSHGPPGSGAVLLWRRKRDKKQLILVLWRSFVY